MTKQIRVGNGFFRKTLEYALTTKFDTDIEILMDPGEYEYNDGWTISHAKIIGNGTNPNDVILHTSFKVKDNGTLILENLKIENHNKDRNACLVSESGKLIATNSIFETIGDTEYPVVIVRGNAELNLCTLVNNTTPDSFSNYGLSIKGHVIAKQCYIRHTSVWDSGQLELQNSAIAAQLWLQKDSNVTADTLTLQKPLTDRYVLGVTDGSSLTIDKLILPESKSYAIVDNGSANVASTEVDDQHQIVFQLQNNWHLDAPGTLMQDLNTPKQTTATESELESESQNKDTTDKTNTDDKESQPTSNAQNDRPAIDQINSMIGLSDLKKQVNSFIAVSKFNKMRADQGANSESQSLHSLFLGNPGTGKTTVARLVAKAMFEAGVMPEDNYVEVTRQDLVSENIGGTAIKTKKVLDSALGGVLFIDEAYTLYQQGGVTNWGQESVDTILKYMEDHRSDIMIIFAGYTKEMQDFINMNPGLTSRAPNIFNFADYTPAEIAKIGADGLTHQQYQFDKEYYTASVERAFKTSVDHSNGRWVRNFNEKLVRIKSTRSMEESFDNPDLFHIENTDIDALTGGNITSKESAVNSLLNELDSMIGLNDVKQFVNNLVLQVKVDRRLTSKLPDMEKPTYHMVFSGSPGTGKTTVARIIAKLFYNLDILPKDTVYEVYRPDLIGRYIGETEEKTSNIIRNAMGGVLFVDEAYQLTANNVSDNDFGPKAVETFITELENNRDKFVAIFAGYTEEMKSFLQANSGLKSRIPLSIEFEDYTPDEIAKIVYSIISKKWSVDQNLLCKVAMTLYSALPNEERSNGRWARNLSDTLVSRHKLWLANNMSVSDPTKIEDETVLSLMNK